MGYLHFHRIIVNRRALLLGWVLFLAVATRQLEKRLQIYRCSDLQAPIASSPYNETKPSSSNLRHPENRSTRDPIADTRHSYGGGFVHIGKTAGSTLSFLLRNGCHSFRKHPCRFIANESPASVLATNYYHIPDFHRLPQSNHDFYIVTGRDPFDRSISAFLYEHIDNRIARRELKAFMRLKFTHVYECFPTLESFVAYLDGNSSEFDYPYPIGEIHPESCRNLARAAFHGHVKVFRHFFVGYEKVLSLLPQPLDTRAYYMTRQEQLFHDWRVINQMLVSRYSSALGNSWNTSTFDIPERQVISSRNSTALDLEFGMPVRNELSTKGIGILCRALEREYRAYFWLIVRSQNLDASEHAYTLAVAQERCGAYLDLESIFQQVVSDK